jgi:hypothetical protein
VTAVVVVAVVAVAAVGDHSVEGVVVLRIRIVLLYPWGNGVVAASPPLLVLFSRLEHEGSVGGIREGSLHRSLRPVHHIEPICLCSKVLLFLTNWRHLSYKC